MEHPVVLALLGTSFTFLATGLPERQWSFL